MKSESQKNKVGKNTLIKLIRESFFVHIIAVVADFLYNGVKNSLFASFFSEFGKWEKKYEQSFTGTILSKLFSVSKNGRKRLFSFAAACENSLLLAEIKKRNSSFLSRPGRFYGSGLIYFGIYTAIVHIAKYLLLVSAEFDSSYLYIGLWAVLSGIVLLSCKKAIGVVLAESRLLAPVFEIVNIDTRAMAKCEVKNVSQGTAIAVGTFLGIITFFVHPLIIFGALVAVWGVLKVLRSPETGLLLVFLLLPFLPTMALAGIVILTAISYFFKVLRGKRVFRLEFFDLLVGLFAVIVFFSGFISGGGSGSLPPALMFVCFMMAYFLTVNLIRSEELINKCALRMIIASVGVSIYGIYQNFFGTTTAAWLDSDMFSEIGNRVVSTFENPNVLGQYLIIMLPFCIMTFAGKAKSVSERWFGLVSSALLGVCLIFTWSRGAWLGALFGIAVMMLIFSRHTMKVFVAGLFCVPILPFVIPDSILGRFTSIGNLGDSSTQYRVNIWKGTLKMVEDFVIGGIGMGEAAFRKIYPYYSLEAIEAAPHSHNLYLQVWVEAGIFAMIFLVILLVMYIKLCSGFVTDKETGLGTEGAGNCGTICLAGFAGIISVLLQGFTDYIWYNYRFFLMFWLVIAICVAAKRIKTEEIKARHSMEQE